jgi:hypothetical protein
MQIKLADHGIKILYFVAVYLIVRVHDLHEVVQHRHLVAARFGDKDIFTGVLLIKQLGDLPFLQTATHSDFLDQIFFGVVEKTIGGGEADQVAQVAAFVMGALMLKKRCHGVIGIFYAFR